MEDISEGGMGSYPHYEDKAKPAFHRRMFYVTDDLFCCEDCGLEKRDMFRSIMRLHLPGMIDRIFKPSPILAYLKRTPSPIPQIGA
jgi:hypothetical protein